MLFKQDFHIFLNTQVVEEQENYLHGQFTLKKRQMQSLTMGLHSFLVFSSGNGLKCWAALQMDPGQDREETLSKEKEGKYKTANFFASYSFLTTGVLGRLINITQGYHLMKQDSKRPSKEVRHTT